MSNGNDYYSKFKPVFISAIDCNPSQWGKDHGYNMEGSIFRVRFEDNREIHSRWVNGGWSCERLKPHLKVKEWKAPILVA